MDNFSERKHGMALAIIAEVVHENTEGRLNEIDTNYADANEKHNTLVIYSKVHIEIPAVSRS